MGKFTARPGSRLARQAQAVRSTCTSCRRNRICRCVFDCGPGPDYKETGKFDLLCIACLGRDLRGAVVM